jgi:hypothetical protein
LPQTTVPEPIFSATARCPRQFFLSAHKGQP